MNQFNDNENFNHSQKSAFNIANHFPKLDLPIKREFGRDITNLHRNIQINDLLKKTQKKTLYDIIKPTKRERDELNKVKNQILAKKLQGTLCDKTYSLGLTDDTPNYFNLYKNPQNVNEYIDDILESMLQSEKNKQIIPYIKSQNDITEKMRAILVDWLLGVHMEFRLLSETLFIAVYMVDKYLEKKNITRNKLQLLGISALFSASKYEEIYPPDISKFVNITDKAYTKSEIIEMEKEILDTLGFDITFGSSLRFFEIIIQLSGFKFEEEFIYRCKYLLDLCLLKYEMLNYSPSFVASAIITFVNKLKRNPYHFDLERILGYTEERINPCLKTVAIIYESVDISELKTAKIKYSSSKYLQVAKTK